MTERQQDIVANTLLAIFLIVMIPIAIVVMLLELIAGNRFISEGK